MDEPSLARRSIHSTTRRFLTILGKAKPTMRATAIVLLITGAMFLVLEGAASVVVVLRRPSGALLERSHTEFDPDLGWVNQRSIHVPDLYGPGLYLQTNAQRFRNKREFDVKGSPRRVRAICTGDSFTLGYGVSNDDAWCEVLSRMDDRVETVNMGQGGYGVDQAYLWYLRDGMPLEHDALVFAFITEDLDRMMSRTFLGYPKPVLAVEKGVPKLVWKPTSRSDFLWTWLRRRAEPFRDLRSIELLTSWSKGRPLEDEMAMDEAQGRVLSLAIVDHLKAVTAQRGTELLVVLLPIAGDYEAESPWRSFLADELQRRQIPFVDLIGALKEEKRERVPRLFRGHYSEVGNRWVAKHLHPALTRLPKVAARLRTMGPAPEVPDELGPANLERIDLKDAKIHATRMDGLAALAIDGSLSTRWHSGDAQRGDEAIVLELGTPRSLRRIELEIGPAPYDFARALVLDVSDDGDLYRQVAEIGAGERALEGTGAQVVALPSAVSARFVRVRQTGRTDRNFWSVYEIGLFAEPK
jgi:hypothetical protein